ncbi:hypothetical protein H5410_040635 [Solanum commersonii]|uniref:Uncharacterized protein n=1 Tax=Solanum commersonii TaxID=4109 RepID=A0A9J5XPI0_SOLCO|nr:hypothetical protein H5410_040635 [Solanum commersonii]
MNVRASGPCELLESMVAWLEWYVQYLQNIEEKLKCKHKKVVVDKLADPIGQSPNLFGELS